VSLVSLVYWMAVAWCSSVCHYEPSSHSFTLLFFYLFLLFPSCRNFLAANSDKIIILKVFAPWCRACKGLEPKFNGIVRDPIYKDLPILFADFTIQHNKDYVKSIGVLALPTIQFYVQKGLVDNFPCGPSKVPILKRKLAQLVEDNIDPLTKQVLALAGDVGLAPNTLDHANGGNVDTPESSAIPPKTPPKEVAPVAVTPKVPSLTATPPKDGSVVISPQMRQKLLSIPYLADMLEFEFDDTLAKARVLSFEAGSIIMREGGLGKTFYVITEGDVEICQKTSFEDPLTTPSAYLGTVINRLEEGDFFGERAMITGEPRAASIRASSKMVKCLAFCRDDFPSTCVLSGKKNKRQVLEEQEEETLQIVNDKYGVALRDLSGDGMTGMTNQFRDVLTANQVRGSINKPQVIQGVDTDMDEEDTNNTQDVKLSVETETIVPLLMRFKLIRLVTRCVDYIMNNRPVIGDEGARRRRNMLVKLLAPWQAVEFTDAYNVVDLDKDGQITIVELRRVMESVGEEKSDDDLLKLIKTGSNQGTGDTGNTKTNPIIDRQEVITYEDFMGLMAEAEFYHLFLDTFRSLDTRDSGFVKAGELDRVLCGVRDLISDDRKSIIDVEDPDILINYEQFSRMLLGTALK
jgi:calmodulin